MVHKITRKLLGLLVLMVVVFTSQLVTPQQSYAATTYNYTALGDSLGAGLWATRGYVQRYREYVQTDTKATVNLKNLSVSGWTSTDLLNALRTNQSHRDAVRTAQIVTFNIGGNDFIGARDKYKARTCGGTDNQDCLRAASATFKENWNAIIAELFALRSGPNVIIRTMDIYNPYVKTDKASDTWSGDAGSDFVVFKPYVDTLNGHIGATATANGIPYAKVYAAFNGANGDVDPSQYGYISWDKLHPNDTGHKKMADLLRALKYAPLVP